MKGKCSNDNPAQSGTHLPRETHRLEILAGIYAGGWVQALMFSVGAPHPGIREHLMRPGSHWGPIEWSLSGVSFPSSAPGLDHNRP